MTLRVKKTKNVCEKFNILERKYHSEKSVLFNLPRSGIKNCEYENFQKQNQYYCEYAVTTQERFTQFWSEFSGQPPPWFSAHPCLSDINANRCKQAKYTYPYYPYGLSLNAYWKTGSQLLQRALAHALLLDLEYTIKMYKKSINIYSPRLWFIKIPV